MIKLNYLEPFDVYRTTPPIIMPESKQNRKKGEAYIIFAPSIDIEFNYLMSDKTCVYRNLYRYFIDKKFDYTLKGSGRKVEFPNKSGVISDLLDAHRKGNLKQVKVVNSYLPTDAARPMKNENVLVEANYITERIINNPKDSRLVSFKVKECMNELERVYRSALPTGYLGNYHVNLIIPISIWLTLAEIEKYNTLQKSSSKHFFAQFMKFFMTPETMKRFENASIYITFSNIVLPIDPKSIPKDDPNILADLYHQFIIRVKVASRKISRAEGISYYSGEEEKTEEEIDELLEKKTESKVKSTDKITREEVAVDTACKTAKIDPDKISPEKKEQISTAIMKAVKKSNPELSVKPSKDEPVLTPDEQENQVQEKPDVDLDINLTGATVQSSDDVDVLLAAKAEGKSVQSYKRNEMLKKKYEELKLGSVPLKEILENDEKYSIPAVEVKANTVNEDMKTIQSHDFEASYNKELANKDLASILLHFSHVVPAMYLNKDIQVVDVSTPTDRLLKYTVAFEDENRKRHQFSFLLPKMYEDKYLYLNDQKMNIIHQKLPYPVTKVSPSKCQAVTNYNKIFTERYGTNLSPRITKLKKFLISQNCPRFISVTTGNSTILNAHDLTTIEFDEIGSSIVQLSMGNQNDYTRFYFTIDEGRAVVPMDHMPSGKITGETVDLLPLAVRNKKQSDKTYFYISSITNKVYDQTGICYDELSEFIITAIGWYDDKVMDEFKKIPTGSQFIYSRSTVMAQDIPTIFVLAAADPGGLQTVLEKAKIVYRFSEKRESIDKDTEAMIPFSNGYLIYQRYPYENSLLLNGLTTVPTKEFSFYDMGSRDTYVEIFDLMYGRRNLYDALRNFYYLFIDPITMDVLIRLNMPTDFTRVMLYCNDILADNTYQIDSDYHNSRLRSNEIIYAYLYKELADAWGLYQAGKAEKFSIKEDAVIKKLLTSNIIDPHSELNLTLETENDRQVKLKGPSGMNEDHSFTIEKRAYHPSMMGVIGMNSTASGEVGINRHMTLNANIIDSRGFMELDKDDYSGSELATPGELLQSFAPESSDIERLAMAISQSKHVVPVKSSTSSPITYDMERVVPYISNDFAKSAKQDGKVVKIENDIMIIQYKDGTYADIDLSKRPAKNTDGGFYIMNQLVSDLKENQSFRKGDILAYDPKYINQNDMFGDPMANVGTLATVAVETNGGVYEDACYMTDDLAHRMTTRITRQKRVILSKYANIKKIAKVGDVLKANDPILVFDDTADEFSSQMLAAMAIEAGDDDVIQATTAPVITKTGGTVTDIKIYYTSKLAEMTPSLKKIVESYNNTAAKREKTISKYMNVYDADTILDSSKQLVPDSLGKVKGVKLPDNIMIDFYIEYEDVIAPGDKISYLNCKVRNLLN